jgi:hypothetical protein
VASFPNPLTPRPGYTVTVAQIVGSYPTVHASCRRCVDFDVTEPVDVAAPVAHIGEVVARLVDDAIHHVSSHISDGG